MNSLASYSHPDHVPDALVVDFDMYGVLDGFADDVHAAWKRVQDTQPPLFWTPRYGGHWVATRGKDIRYMIENYAEFSNREIHIPQGVVPRIIPVQLDPPDHGLYRRLIMSAFLPKALVQIEQKARETAIEIIERIKPRGECDFVAEFAGAMPIIAFLAMLDLPAGDARMLRSWIALAMPATNPRAHECWENLTDYLRGWIACRKEKPGTDLISRIVMGEIDGRRLTDAEILSMCQLLVGGGLDTVVTMTSFVARFLATHPEERRRLREEPGLIRGAIEEFARRFGTTNLGRQVNVDMVYRGVQLRKGDMVLLPTPLYGLDELVNECPMTVDLTRKNPRHLAFGIGTHTCPGAVLARREMTIFLEEWLPRIPDFHLKPGRVPFVTTGVVNSMGELWLQWDT